MKHFFGIAFCLLCTNAITIAQDINPIYGLGLCDADTYYIHISKTSPLIRSEPLSVCDDSCLQAFFPQFEDGLDGFINGDHTHCKHYTFRLRSPSCECTSCATYYCKDSKKFK